MLYPVPVSISFFYLIFLKQIFFVISPFFQDIVYALAHATGRTGRFTLIERWRNNERLLAPQEHPLQVNLKNADVKSIVELFDDKHKI